jgi:opacity protein-like surface antigen
MRSAAAAAALALLAPAAATAQPVSFPAGPGPDTYLEFHLGAFLPQSDALDDVDPGYAFGGTFGARVSRHLGVEMELGYLRATGERAGLETTFADFPIAASVRLRAPAKAVEISLLGGAALHFASFSREFAVSGPVTRVSDDVAAFGFHAGGEIAFHVTPTMLVGAEVRRTFFRPKIEGERVRLDGLRAALTLSYHL